MRHDMREIAMMATFLIAGTRNPLDQTGEIKLAVQIALLICDEATAAVDEREARTRRAQKEAP